MALTKATASDVTVSLGLVSFPVDLVPATRSKSTKSTEASTKMVCPTCAPKTLNPLQQRYVCSGDASHGPFGKGDAVTALVVDGVLHLPTRGLVAEAVEAQGVRGNIELTVYPAVQVEAHTMPSGNIYRLRPRANPEHYALVLELAGDRDVAFLGEVTLKGVTKLYRVVTRDGGLVLTELVRPSEFHVPEPVDVAFDPKLLAPGRLLVESLVEDFDPGAFADRRKERLAALARRVAPVTAVPEQDDRSAVRAAADLMEQLRQSVEAVKAA